MLDVIGMARCGVLTVKKAITMDRTIRRILSRGLRDMLLRRPGVPVRRVGWHCSSHPA